jgi:hypothetical protein
MLKIRMMPSPRFFLLPMLLAALTSCSKAKDAPTEGNPFPAVQTFPIENSQLKNCRFAVPNPVYTLNQKIADNKISCDEGVPRTVQTLGTGALPSGIQFSMDKLALTGTPGERMSSGNYSFYLENESGYVILKMSLTVK